MSGVPRYKSDVDGRKSFIPTLFHGFLKGRRSTMYDAPCQSQTQYE